MMLKTRSSGNRRSINQRVANDRLINRSRIVSHSIDSHTLAVTLCLAIVTRMKLFWVGDRSSESSLPPGVPPQTIQTYERLARALDDRIPHSPQTSTTLSALFSDTVALSASLNSSFILTRQSATADCLLLPEICLELESLGISCQMLKLEDEMVAIEQDYLRQLFV
jgi:hypothetical protein